MTTTIQPKKKIQSCLSIDSDYLNKWTLAIFALFLLMTTSVALAICFPYQGTEPHLRVTADDVGGDGTNSVVMDSTVLDSAVVGNTMVLEDNSVNADVMVIKQNNDITTTDQEVVVSQTNDVAEASVPSVAQDSGDNNDNNNNNSNGGLFGSSATATDEQPSSGASNEQAATATGAESDSDNNSSSSSCQMKLRLADANLDNIIDTSEYITFLQHFVGDIPLGTTQFDELESEYQVNFDHLAMAHTSNGGGEDNNKNGVVGIPIATLDEMQKVCVYISNKGSSAVGGFDWDKISSSP